MRFYIKIGDDEPFIMRPTWMLEMKADQTVYQFHLTDLTTLADINAFLAQTGIRSFVTWASEEDPKYRALAEEIKLVRLEGS